MARKDADRKGGGPRDELFVATTLANGVQRIYTFNPGDFQFFAELAVVVPAQPGGTGGTKKRYLTPFSFPFSFRKPSGPGHPFHRNPSQRQVHRVGVV